MFLAVLDSQDIVQPPCASSDKEYMINSFNGIVCTYIHTYNGVAIRYRKNELLPFKSDASGEHHVTWNKLNLERQVPHIVLYVEEIIFF